MTLLRGDPDPESTSRPLFELDDYIMGSPAPRLVGRNSRRTIHPGLHGFQPQSLLPLPGHAEAGNVFSTHSNVFAIWITVGYFEVGTEVEQ